MEEDQVDALVATAIRHGAADTEALRKDMESLAVAISDLGSDYPDTWEPAHEVIRRLTAC
jgi:hypothetical protein